MKDYLNEINQKFPTRRDKSEKDAFFEYVKQELSEYSVKKETLEDNDNIIIGDLQSAPVIFTAHYDTPATSIFPNIMMPRNKILSMVYHVGCPLLLALLALAIAFGINSLIGKQLPVAVGIYLVLYYSFWYFGTRCFKNKNNKNDNTSGVATLLTLAKQVSGKCAFILFDNEEKGLKGSKAIAKAKSELFKNKLVVNFDCVGNGNEFVFIAKEGALKSQTYDLLIKTFEKTPVFNLNYFPYKGSSSNSDYKNFDLGVGVMACKKGKACKYVTSKIHTNKDVVANSENVYYLANESAKFVNKLTEI